MLLPREIGELIRSLINEYFISMKIGSKWEEKRRIRINFHNILNMDRFDRKLSPCKRSSRLDVVVSPCPVEFDDYISKSMA